MDTDIELWRIKRLIKNLESMRGNGTSMISLVIPPKDQISRVNKMLGDELGTASNIKSRVNRLSVLGAITSAQQRLKLYSRVPKNGLVVYVGTVINANGKEKKMTIDFEPFKPINTSLYLCDNRFHTEPLGELLQSNDRFGFIVMDGNGCLFGAVSGNTRETLHEFSVDLPKKHGRGGQSALRFARLRLEKRHNYVRKVAEFAVQHFISNDQPNVQGLILAGSAEFKTELNTSDLFDKRLQEIVLKIVDVSYGSDMGFSHAIELAAETLSNVKFVQEQKLISGYFEAISLDTGKYCFGVKDTLAAMEMGAAETVICYEELDVTRYVCNDIVSKSEGAQPTIIYLTAEQENNRDQFFKDMDIVDSGPLVEWLAQNYQHHGCQLEFVSDKSQEGSQFCQGFGGIGALLRYQVDFTIFADDRECASSDSDDDLLNEAFDDLDGFL